VKQDSSLEKNLIRARTRQQALDWNLALLSQGVASELIELDGGWALRVGPDEVGKAARVLRLYQVENRHWYRYFLPSPQRPLWHPGVLVWTVLMAFVYAWMSSASGDERALGTCDTSRLVAGEVWRLWTAISLHADLPHLLGNLTFGTLLLGLAMARFGGGWTQLTALLGAVAANALSAGLHGLGHRGLGASGMVMAALGLLAVGSPPFSEPRRALRGWLSRGLLGGFLLFILVGLDPATDVLAHAGGFLSGMWFGWILLRLPASWRSSVWCNQAAALAALAMMVACWILALSLA